MDSSVHTEEHLATFRIKTFTAQRNRERRKYFPRRSHVVAFHAPAISVSFYPYTFKKTIHSVRIKQTTWQVNIRMLQGISYFFKRKLVTVKEGEKVRGNV